MFIAKEYKYELISYSRMVIPIATNKATLTCGFKILVFMDNSSTFLLHVLNTNGSSAIREHCKLNKNTINTCVLQKVLVDTMFSGFVNCKY